MRYRYSSLLSTIYILADSICLNLAFIIAYYVKFDSFDGAFKYPYLFLLLLINLFWFILLLIVNPYKSSRVSSSISQLLTNLLIIILLHVALTAFYWFAMQTYYYSRVQLLGMYCCFFVLGIIWRIIFIWAIRQYRLQGYNNRNFVIIGECGLANLIIKYHQSHPELGYQYKGYFGEPSDNLPKRIGDYENLSPFLENNEIDYIYCYLPKIDTNNLNNIIACANKTGCEVKLLMDFSSFISHKINIEYHDLIPVINISSVLHGDFKTNFLKRSFDVCFSFFALFVGTPLLLLIACITKLTSNGPVIYSQERIGLLGKPFKIYKFRSMYINAEKAGPALSNGSSDSRITPWGQFMRKTRLDELPQFWNVLVGDMSIVGPRPERQYFIDQIVKIAPEYINLLHTKPGITSIGQVKYGYASDIDEMIERMNQDLTYIPSFRQDISLIFETIKVMLLAKGK